MTYIFLQFKRQDIRSIGRYSAHLWYHWKDRETAYYWVPTCEPKRFHSSYAIQRRQTRFSGRYWWQWLL